MLFSPFLPCSHWIDMDWGLDSMDSGPEMGTQEMSSLKGSPLLSPETRRDPERGLQSWFRPAKPETPETGFQHVHAPTNIYIMYMYILYTYIYVSLSFWKKNKDNTRKSEVRGNFPTRLVANWEAHTIYNLLTVQLWLVPGINDYKRSVTFQVIGGFSPPIQQLYQGGSKTQDSWAAGEPSSFASHPRFGEIPNRCQLPEIRAPQLLSGGGSLGCYLRFFATL